MINISSGWAPRTENVHSFAKFSCGWTPPLTHITSRASCDAKDIEWQLRVIENCGHLAGMERAAQGIVRAAQDREWYGQGREQGREAK